MEYRSTNAGQHLSNNLVAGVGSSHGVEIGSHPTSTGACVQAVGDDTNITLSLFGKGTGGVVIGNSSSPVTIGSSGGAILLGGSTAPFSGFARYTDTAVATPDFNTTNAMVMETTHTLTGVNSSHFVLASPRNLSTDCALLYTYPASTAGQVHCRFLKASTLTVAASTATIDFLAFRF